MLAKTKCKNESDRFQTLGNCDTESEKFYQEVDAIKGAACTAPKTSKADCGKALVDVLFARYQLRYPLADWGIPVAWCKANPALCNFGDWRGAILFEMNLKVQHNKAVHDMAMGEKDVIEQRTAVDELQRRRAYLDTLQAMQGPPAYPTNCTSTKFGNIINTQCH